jgi:hypothetical protein
LVDYFDYNLFGIKLVNALRYEPHMLHTILYLQILLLLL